MNLLPAFPMASLLVLANVEWAVAHDITLRESDGDKSAKDPCY